MGPRRTRQAGAPNAVSPGEESCSRHRHDKDGRGRGREAKDPDARRTSPIPDVRRGGPRGTVDAIERVVEEAVGHPRRTLGEPPVQDVFDVVVWRHAGRPPMAITRCIRVQRRAHRAMGVVETRADRAHRDPEDLGDLGRVTALEVAEHEQGPLLGRQVAEAPLELVPIGDADEVVGRGRDVQRQDAEVRDPSTLALRLGEAGADDEAMEPRVEPVWIAEPGQVTPGDDQRLLQGILSPIDVAEDPMGERVQSVAADPDQVGVCLPVTVPCRLDQIAVHRASFSVAPVGGAVRSLWGHIVGCPSIFADGPARLVDAQLAAAATTQVPSSPKVSAIDTCVVAGPTVNGVAHAATVPMVPTTPAEARSDRLLTAPTTR